MSPVALMEIEEKAQHLVHLDRVNGLLDEIYALDVSTFVDRDFEVLERILDAIGVMLTAVSSADDTPLLDRLRVAREGVEQGMAPDPSKRPSLEQMRQFVAMHLA